MFEIILIFLTPLFALLSLPVAFVLIFYCVVEISLFAKKQMLATNLRFFTTGTILGTVSTYYVATLINPGLSGFGAVLGYYTLIPMVLLPLITLCLVGVLITKLAKIKLVKLFGYLVEYIFVFTCLLLFVLLLLKM